jgi:hypothetical protein
MADCRAGRIKTISWREVCARLHRRDRQISGCIFSKNLPTKSNRPAVGEEDYFSAGNFGGSESSCAAVRFHTSGFTGTSRICPHDAGAGSETFVATVCRIVCSI